MTRANTMEETEVQGEGAPVSLADWLSSFGTGNGLSFKLARRAPKFIGTEKVEGHLDTYDEPWTEDEIRSVHGGGEYTYTVAGPDPKRQGKHGNLAYKVVKISGEPKFDPAKFPLAAARAAAVASGKPMIDIGAQRRDEEPSLVSQAMKIQADTTNKERERAERAESAARDAGRMDADTIDALTKPYRDQVDALRRSLEKLEERAEARDRERDTQPKESVHDTYRGLIDTSSAQLDRIRAAHDSELQALRSRYEGDLSDARRRVDQERERADARMNDALAALRAAHEREIRSLEKNQESERRSLDTGKATETKVLESRIKDLERQLSTAALELSELRTRKEKTLIESVKEMAETKEAMDSITGGGGGKDDDDEMSVMGLIKTVGGPIFEGIGQRIANMPSAQQQQQMQQPPPHLRRRRPQQQPQRQMTQAEHEAAAMAQAQAQQQAAAQHAAQRGHGPPVQQQEAAPTQIQIDPDELKLAVQFLESAVSNGANAQNVAAQARSVVPMPILQGIQAVGIERFLVDYAKVPAESPLLSNAGKKFTRKLVQYLTQPAGALGGFMAPAAGPAVDMRAPAPGFVPGNPPPPPLTPGAGEDDDGPPVEG